MIAVNEKPGRKGRILMVFAGLSYLTFDPAGERAHDRGAALNSAYFYIAKIPSTYIMCTVGNADKHGCRRHA